MIKRNGQVQSQVFIFMFILIIVSLTLLFGYKYISKLSQKGEDISLNIFKEDFKKEIKSTSFKFGDVNLVELRLNNKYTEACFVDSNTGKALDLADVNGLEDYTLIYNEIDSGAQKNVYLIINKGEFTGFDAGSIEAENGFVCIKNSGVLKLRLEGKGNRTKISSQ